MPPQQEQGEADFIGRQWELRRNLAGPRARPRPSGDDFEFLDPGTLDLDGSADRRLRLAEIVATVIAPRLAEMHAAPTAPVAIVVAAPGPGTIAEFAALVLQPDYSPAERYIIDLRDRGVPIETLFLELLEPTAGYLGRMWQEDECDFLDVARGVLCLQTLLAKFDCVHEVPAAGELRTLLMATMPGETHSLGVAMVEKFFAAWGWGVQSERQGSTERLVEIVANRGFAVVGLNVSSTLRLTTVARTIHEIRAHSKNAAIGILVGGSVFLERPELVAAVGADATAVNASLALAAAERLFNAGVRKRAAR